MRCTFLLENEKKKEKKEKKRKREYVPHLLWNEKKEDWEAILTQLYDELK